MVETGAGPKKLFKQLQQIRIVDKNNQDCVYSGLLGIGNVGNNVLPNPLVVSALKKVAGSVQEVQNVYDRGR